MIAILLILFAAVFKAIADTLQHRFDSSVFRRYNAKWWDPDISYKYVKFLPLTKYRLDGWHLFNSLMIGCFICGFVFSDCKLVFVLPGEWYWQLLILVAEFNLAFNLFYNKILR